jgi:RHS repeat-associated protein
MKTTRASILAGAAGITILFGLSSPLPLIAAPSASLTGTPPAMPEAMSYESSAIAAGTNSGYLPGYSVVDPDGKYVYGLPLDVPDGRNGMQPRLSLNYASYSSNGLLGVGWSLGGLSEITRCGKTLSADGTTHGINFDSSDNFCLGGMKLVMASAGQYGAPGAEYRTEQDSFAKVVAEGGTREAGPDRFVVWDKSGRRLTYKAHSATRRSADGDGMSVVSTVKFIWLLDSEQDRYGNTIGYEYATADNDNDGFYFRPHRINYTGHTNGTLPKRYIEFGYVNRSNATAQQRYVNGVKVSLPGVLQTISAYAPNPTATVLAWRYILSYETSDVSGRPRLTSIKKCGSLDTCHLARTFEWSRPGTGTQWTARTVDTGISVGMADLRTAPLYDGRADDAILQWIDSGGNKHARLYRPTMVAPASLTPLGEKIGLSGDDAGFTTGESLPTLNLADIDGDQRAEIIQTRQRVSEAFPYYTSSTLLCSLWLQSSDPSGTNQFTLLDASSWTKCYVNAINWGLVIPTLTMRFADMDGDAIPEWIAHATILGQEPPENRWWAMPQGIQSNHIFANSATNTEEVSDIDSLCGSQLVDLDGDGKSELLGHRVVNTSVGSVCHHEESLVARDNDLASFTLLETKHTKKYPSFASLFGDFNGDGLQDAIVPSSAFNPLKPSEAVFDGIRFNTGNGFLPRQGISVSGGFLNTTNGDSDRGVHVVDVNGDGKDDLVNFTWSRTFSVSDSHADSAWTTTGGNIVVFYSRGDGTFDRVSLGLDPGTRDNAKCVSVAGVSTCRARGWSASTLGDFNGDGRIDLIRLIATGSTHKLEILEQRADFVDRIVAVKDESSHYARESVFYGTHWSDVNEKDANCGYPTPCVPRGIDVVKRVETSSHKIDVSNRPVRKTYYDYRKPRLDRRGRGFLGFEEFRVWEPLVPRETIYRFADTADRVIKDKRASYPFERRPTSITVATPLMKQGEIGQLESANTRIVHKSYTYKTHYPSHSYVPGNPAEPSGYEFTMPASAQTAEWESAAAINWNVPAVGSGNAENTHVHSYAMRLSDAPRRNEEAFTYDDFGNLTHYSQDISGGTKTKHETDYRNSTADWLIGLPTLRTVTIEEPDPSAGASARTEEYVYDAFGRIDSVVTEGEGTDNVKLTQRFYHDATYGNLKGIITTTPSSAVTRERRFEYGTLVAGAPDEQIYVSQAWSPMTVAAYRPSTWFMMHPAYGRPLRTQDANGVQTVSRYDDLGRIKYTDHDAREPLYTVYRNRADTGGGINGMLIEQKVSSAPTGSGAESTATHRMSFDAAGRLVESAQQGFPGGFNAVKYEYDSLGRMSRRSRPHSMGTSAHYTEYAYDSLGRRLRITNPDGSVRTLEHSQFLTKSWDERGDERQLSFDVDGRVVARTELLDGSPKQTHFSYAPFNLLREVKDPAGRSMLAQYDSRGRQTYLSDPNGGIVRFELDGFGEVRKQIRGDVESTSNTEIYSHDELGRLTDILGPDGASVLEWDKAANGVGKLYRQTSPDGVEVRHAYDSDGRERQSRTIVGARSYYLDYTYDSKGRLETVAYPEVTGRDRFTVKYSYDIHSRVKEVGDATTSTYAPLYKVFVRDAAQNAIFASYGADVVTLTQVHEELTGRLDRTQVSAAGSSVLDMDYDYYANGLMERRSDSVLGRDEGFDYDDLRRLSNWTLTHASTNARDVDYDYDDVGNMTDVSENGVLTEHYCYGQADGTAPYAVTSIRNSASCTGGTAQYVYDAWGRQTSHAGNRTVTYNFLDLPKTVVKGSTTHSMKYDALGHRIRKTGGHETTVYVRDLYEKRTALNVHHRHVFRIPGPDGEIGQVIQTESPLGNSTSIEYTIADPQGTPAALIAGSGDKQGKVISRFHFDPYGRRINANGTPFSGSTGNTSDGIGGHEYDDELGLVNMGGRIYDAGMRRFLSVDPYISSPTMSQSYNPYSYAWNSPLSHSDPTGFSVKPDCLSRSGLGCGGGVPPVEVIGNPEEVIDFTGMGRMYEEIVTAAAPSYAPSGGQPGGPPVAPPPLGGSGLLDGHFRWPHGGPNPRPSGNWIGWGPAAWAATAAGAAAAALAASDLLEAEEYKKSDDYHWRTILSKALMDEMDALNGAIQEIESIYSESDEPMTEQGLKDLDKMKRRLGNMEKAMQDHNDYFNRSGRYAPERSPTEQLFRKGIDIIKDIPTGQ